MASAGSEGEGLGDWADWLCYDSSDSDPDESSDEDPISNPDWSLGLDQMIDMIECTQSKSAGLHHEIHPLLIGEVMDKIFVYLNTDDLRRCFDVCHLWRQLVRPHNRRANKSQPPLVLEKDLRDTRAQAYLELIRKDRSFRASKFCFKNTDLNAPAVQQFLRENGDEVEELGLQYSDWGHRGSGRQSGSDLWDVLKDKAPNLKVLKIHQLPTALYIPWRIERGAPLDLNSNLAVNSHIGVTRIEIVGCASRFLDSLLPRCPRLEELIIKPSAWSCQHISPVIQSFHRSNCLAQIEIEVHRVNLEIIHNLRNSLATLAPGQLRSFRVLQHKGDFGVFSPLSTPHLCLLEQLLTQQRGSLERLQKEIDDDQTFSLGPPLTSVTFFQEIPPGVDQALMARIGRLFPNLSIIRTAIPYAHEQLLISVCEFCPHITELFLTLDDDEARWVSREAQERPGLDSIFTGIPQAECRRLRGMCDEEQEPELAETNFGKMRARTGAPSVCNLKKLKRLCIDGPSKVLYPGARGPKDRGDRLSNVFGFAGLAELSPAIHFFQAGLGLIRLSAACVAHIYSRTGLNHVTADEPGFSDEYGRLIRPGVGLESLGSVPFEWWGKPFLGKR